MQVLSWNIQWCRGMDGVVDPLRIARRIRELGDADLICLQEVTLGCDGLAGNSGEDQVAALSAAFPQHSAHYAASFESHAGNVARQFGNLILSRRPVQRVIRYALPWPSEAGAVSIPRAAIELEVEAPWGSLRLLTTHLEYYAPQQREAQVQYLRALHREACGHALVAPGSGGSVLFTPVPRPRDQIVTGDFNLASDSDQYARLMAPFEGAAPDWRDAWQVTHGDAPHAPTVLVHEARSGRAPFCCDFLLLTDTLAPRLRSFSVDAVSRDSDHQAVVAQFED